MKLLFHRVTTDEGNSNYVTTLDILFVIFVFIHYISTVYSYSNQIMRYVVQYENDKVIFWWYNIKMTKLYFESWMTRVIQTNDEGNLAL